MSGKEYLSPISYENGELVVNANCTEANDDFIRASRLQEKADEGDEEAAEKFQEMEGITMVRFPKENA